MQIEPSNSEKSFSAWNYTVISCKSLIEAIIFKKHKQFAYNLFKKKKKKSVVTIC